MNYLRWCLTRKTSGLLHGHRLQIWCCGKYQIFIYIYTHTYIYIYINIYIYIYIYIYMYINTHTVWSKISMNDIFKIRWYILNTHTFFFIQNKLYWHIYRFLRSPTVRANLPKNSLFWPSLILQLCLLEFQQHPQRGVLLTLFPNWGKKIVCRR